MCVAAHPQDAVVVGGRREPPAEHSLIEPRAERDHGAWGREGVREALVRAGGLRRWTLGRPLLTVAMRPSYRLTISSAVFFSISCDPFIILSRETPVCSLTHAFMTRVLSARAYMARAT